MKSVLRYMFALIGISLISSCKIINPSFMLKTPKDYQFKEPPQTLDPTYRLRPDDDLRVLLYSNDGFRLVEVTGGNQMMMAQGRGLTYPVEFDGTCKLPLVGRIEMANLTVREAENKLQELYTEFYVSPFVLIRVMNRRVTVFNGQAGAAQVVFLNDDNITLMEALARAGGTAQFGRAYRIKLIRGQLNNPEVFLFDLSTIEGFKKANIYLQTNDIVYVEPAPRYAAGLLAQAAPIISILTSAFILYSFSRRL
jgi:polysaccharide biosynthesis/export protein